MKLKQRTLSIMLALAMAASLLPRLPATPAAFALSGTASYTPAESNIAVKYWVSATASINADDAGLAIDGDPETAWIADDAAASLTVDLSGAYDALRKTEVVFAGADSAYQYKIEGSADNIEWFLLADRTGNARVAKGFTDIFSHAGIRYLKLTVTGGSPVGVKEFKIKGTAAAKGNMNDVTATVTVLSNVTKTEAQAIPDEVAHISFNEGWQFLLATRTPADATGGFATNGLADPPGMPTTAEIIDPEFDDSDWRTVQVPHDFSIKGPKASSGSSDSQNYLQGGLGWYRKDFTIPESMKGAKCVQLDFEGVYQNSNVYVNG